MSSNNRLEGMKEAYKISTEPTPSSRDLIVKIAPNLGQIYAIMDLHSVGHFRGPEVIAVHTVIEEEM